MKPVAMAPRLIIIQGTMRGLSFSCLAKCRLKAKVPTMIQVAKPTDVPNKSLDMFMEFN